MTLSESIWWSFARSVIIASVALWPVAVLVRQIESCVRVRARRVWLLLSVFPLFVPELLTGFNYRLTATQLSLGTSPLMAATCTELLYSLLQISRCMAVGIAVAILVPRSDVTRESIHLWTLLRTSVGSRRREAVDLMGSDPLRTVAEAKNGGFFASISVMKGSDPIKSTLSWWRGWLALRLTGPWQPMVIGWSVMALITFQEFETAALMQIDRHPIAWSVWLFDAHAARQPLTDSLRMIVPPIACEALLLFPALFLLLKRHRYAKSGMDVASSEIPRLPCSRHQSFVAAAFVLPGILLMLVWPICANLKVTAVGFVSILTQSTLLRRSMQQILTSTAFAAGATFLAMALASGFFSVKSATTDKSRTRWLLIVLLVPGLSGSLVMSLLLLAMFQFPGMRMLYDTWLPMLLGQTIAVLPKTFAVVILLQKITDHAAIHSAGLLMASADLQTRRNASSILWRMKTSRWLLGGLVVAHWCFWDVTVASILRPVQPEPVVTRLYNEMHYGRTEALMSLSVLAAVIPLIIWIMTVAVIRLASTRFNVTNLQNR